MLENVDNWSTNISVAQIVKIVNKPRLKIDFFLSAPRSWLLYKLGWLLL